MTCPDIPRLALFCLVWVIGHRLTWNVVGLLITTSIAAIWAAILKL